MFITPEYRNLLTAERSAMQELAKPGLDAGLRGRLMIALCQVIRTKAFLRDRRPDPRQARAITVPTAVHFIDKESLSPGGEGEHRGVGEGEGGRGIEMTPLSPNPNPSSHEGSPGQRNPTASNGSSNGANP